MSRNAAASSIRWDEELAAARALFANAEYEQCAAVIGAMLRKPEMPAAIAGAARELYLRAESETQREADIRNALDAAAAAWIAGDSSKMLAELARVPLESQKADIAARRAELAQNLERLRAARSQLITARGLLQQGEIEAARRELQKAAAGGALPVSISAEVRKLLEEAEGRLAEQRAERANAARAMLRAAQDAFGEGGLDDAEQQLSRGPLTQSDLPVELLTSARQLRGLCRKAREALERIASLRESLPDRGARAVLADLEASDLSELPLLISDAYADLRSELVAMIASEAQQARTRISQLLEMAEKQIDDGDWTAGEELLYQVIRSEHIDPAQAHQAVRLQTLASSQPAIASLLEDAERLGAAHPDAVESRLGSLPSDLLTWAARRRVALHEAVRAARERERRERAEAARDGLSSIPEALMAGQVEAARATLAQVTALLEYEPDLALRHAALTAEVQRHERWRARRDELQRLMGLGELRRVLAECTEALTRNPPEFWANAIKRLKEEAARRIQTRKDAITRQLRSFEAQVESRGRRVRNLEPRLAALCNDPLVTAEQQQFARQLIASYNALPEPGAATRGGALVLLASGTGLAALAIVFAWTLWGGQFMSLIQDWRSEQPAEPVVAFTRATEEAREPQPRIAIDADSQTTSVPMPAPAAAVLPDLATATSSDEEIGWDASPAESESAGPDADEQFEPSSAFVAGVDETVEEGFTTEDFEAPPALPAAQPAPQENAMPEARSFEKAAAEYEAVLGLELGPDFEAELTLPDESERFSATARFSGLPLLPFEGLAFDAKHGIIDPPVEQVIEWFYSQQRMLAAVDAEEPGTNLATSALPAPPQSPESTPGGNEPEAESRFLAPGSDAPASVDAAPPSDPEQAAAQSEESPPVPHTSNDAVATSEAAPTPAPLATPEHAEPQRSPLDEMLTRLATAGSPTWDDLAAAIEAIAAHKLAEFGAQDCQIAPSWSGASSSRERLLALTRSYQRFLARFAPDMTPTHFVELVATPSALYGVGWQARTSGDDYILDVAAPVVWIASAADVSDTVKPVGEALIGPVLGGQTIRASGAGAIGLVVAPDGEAWNASWGTVELTPRTVQGLRGGARVERISSIDALLADENSPQPVYQRRRASLWCVPALAVRFRGDSRGAPELKIPSAKGAPGARLPFVRGPKFSLVAGAPVGASDAPCGEISQIEADVFPARFWKTRGEHSDACRLLTLLPDNE